MSRLLLLLLGSLALALLTAAATASADQPAPATWNVPGGVTALAATPSGDVVAVSPHAVTRFDAAGAVRWTTPLESVHASAAVTADGDVWLADGNAQANGMLPGRVTRIPAGGGPAAAWAPAGVTLPDAPTALTADPQGRLLIAFSNGFAPGGIPARRSTPPSPFPCPSAGAGRTAPCSPT